MIANQRETKGACVASPGEAASDRELRRSAGADGDQPSPAVVPVGTNTKMAMEGAGTALQIYAERLDAVTDSGREAQLMMERMVKTADLSKATQDQIFQFSADALQQGKSFGFEFEEVLALFPQATSISSSPAQAGTGVRNFLQRMAGKAPEVLGIELSGNLTEDMRKVADATQGDMALIAQIWEQELSGFANTLLASVDKIEEAERRIRGTELGESLTKLALISRDPQSRHADLMGGVQQALANVDVMRASDPGKQRQSLLFGASELQLRHELGPAFDAALAENPMAVSALAAQGPDKGLKLLRDFFRQGGDDIRADFLEVMFGEQFGHRTGRRLRVTGPAGPGGAGVAMMRPGFTGADEADLFSVLNAAVASDTALPDRIGEQFGAFTAADSAGGKRITPEELSNGLQTMNASRDDIRSMTQRLDQLIGVMEQTRDEVRKSNRSRPPVGAD